VPRTIDGLLPQVYDHLRAIASNYLKRETQQLTLQPTALVHEAYLRLADAERINWSGKTHVLALMAREMRRILVDHARRASAKKRGRQPRRVTLTDRTIAGRDRSLELLVLDQALHQLATRSKRQASVAELRVFAGLNIREVAHALGVSERTVKGDWQIARAWLARELKTGGE